MSSTSTSFFFRVRASPSRAPRLLRRSYRAQSTPRPATIADYTTDPAAAFQIVRAIRVRSRRNHAPSRWVEEARGPSPSPKRRTRTPRQKVSPFDSYAILVLNLWSSPAVHPNPAPSIGSVSVSRTRTVRRPSTRTALDRSGSLRQSRQRHAVSISASGPRSGYRTPLPFRRTAEEEGQDGQSPHGPDRRRRS